MDKIKNSFEHAKRSNFVPVLLLLISLYLLYFSIIDYTLVGVIICSLFILASLYMTIVNLRYNLYLKKMLSKVDSNLDFVLCEMTELLSKIDTNSSKFRSNISGAHVSGTQGIGVRNELQKNFEKRKKIAAIVYSITLYKKNNIK